MCLQSLSYTKKCGKGNQEEKKVQWHEAGADASYKGDVSTGDIWDPSAMNRT